MVKPYIGICGVRSVIGVADRPKGKMKNHWTDKNLLKHIIDKFSKRLAELSGMDVDKVKGMIEKEAELMPPTSEELASYRSMPEDELLKELEEVYLEIIESFKT